MPRSQLLGHIVVAGLVFKDTPKLFSSLAVPFYISSITVGVTQFLHIISSTEIQHH